MKKITLVASVSIACLSAMLVLSSCSQPTQADGKGPKGLAAPTGISASQGLYSDGVLVQWSAVSGAAKYRVYRASSSGGSYAELGDTADASSLSGADYSATVGPHFWYKVAAVDGSGNAGDMSAAAEGWVSATPTAPSPPTGVLASDGNSTSSITVTWNAVSSATSYDVYRSTSPSSGYSLAGTVAVLTYTDSSAAAGTLYYYEVKAKNTNGTSDYSSSDSGYLALAAPSSVTASDGTSTSYVRISWSSVAGASSYTIYRSTSSGSGYSSIGSSGTMSYDDTGATASTTYYYEVRAYCSATSGYSAYSAYDSGYKASVTPPAAPSGLTINVASASSLQLSWTDNSSNESGFKIYTNSSSLKPSSPTYTTSTNATSYTATGLSSGITYIWVTAYNSGGESDYVYSSGNLKAPTLVTSTPAAYGSFTLTTNYYWGGIVSSSDQYSLESSTSGPTTGFTVMNTFSASAHPASYTITITPDASDVGKQYYFRLRVKDNIYYPASGSYYSPYSPVVSVHIYSN